MLAYLRSSTKLLQKNRWINLFKALTIIVPCFFSPTLSLFLFPTLFSLYSRFKCFGPKQRFKQSLINKLITFKASCPCFLNLLLSLHLFLHWICRNKNVWYGLKFPTYIYKWLLKHFNEVFISVNVIVTFWSEAPLWTHLPFSFLLRHSRCH